MNEKQEFYIYEGTEFHQTFSLHAEKKQEQDLPPFPVVGMRIYCVRN